MSAPFVLYLVLIGFTTALCLWAAATSTLRIQEHGVAHRAWTFVAGLLLPPVLAVTALCDLHGYGAWKPIGVALPALTIAITWSNVMTLRDQHFLAKLLHAPIFVFNTTLAGIYAVRAAQDVGGADFGSLGATLTATHTALQTWVGHRDADSLPIWLHLPIALPLCLHFRFTHGLVLLVAAFVATALLSVLALAAPAASFRVDSYRGNAPTVPLADAARLEVGVRIAWPQLAGSETVELQQRLQSLGIDHLVVDVDPELFRDDATVERVARELQTLRDRGLTIVASVRPARIYRVVPAADLVELGAAMAKTQWLCAERLAPDLSILFTGPFGELARQLVRPGTLDEWSETIHRAARESRQANPAVRVAVALDATGPHGEELYRRLKADDSPVDVVGFAVHVGGRPLAEIEAHLATLARWCERVPGDRPVRVLDAGAGPHTCGGELGQWHFLATILRFAATTPAIRGVVLGTAIDRSDAFGLLAGNGRPRRAYLEIARMLGARHAPAARPPR